MSNQPEGSRKRRWWPLHRVVGSIVVVLIALETEACFSDHDLTEPESARPALVQTPIETDGAALLADVTENDLMGIDKRFFQISKTVPEFAGYWMDQRGDVVIGLTDLSKTTAITR
ncbi:hypothetical protein [Candidatus Palauibacter sp.]|uniref:hypothetical protein n=1 Tax=Candidatus Palauibacter sp. TaxID=3101350 RepID=UPI003C6FCD78